MSTSRMPHWGWCLAAMVAIVIPLVWLLWGWPIYREYGIISEWQLRGLGVESSGWGPHWLRTATGNKWTLPFGDIRIVGFGGMTDADGCFSDEDLARCASLKYAKCLKVQTVPRITSAGLSHLAELTDLVEISLVGNGVSNTDLQGLPRLPALRVLDLSGTQVSDDGFMIIGSLTGLIELDLHNVCISDVGLAYLRGLSHLEILYLTGTQVTDEGLLHLHGLSSLQTLVLYETQATSEGVARLKAVLPHLRVFGPAIIPQEFDSLVPMESVRRF